VAENLAVGTGRRKTAVARVFLKPGSGEITVNGKKAEEYFSNPSLLYVVKQPLEVTDSLAKYDILINTLGGGPSGQAGACRHGIARALVERVFDPGPQDGGEEEIWTAGFQKKVAVLEAVTPYQAAKEEPMGGCISAFRTAPLFLYQLISRTARACGPVSTSRRSWRRR